MLPVAEECEIHENDFLHMTMRSIKNAIEGFRKRQKNDWERIEYHAWLNGYYNMQAIGTYFSRKVKYPQNPLNREQVVVDDMDLTEEEKDFYRDQFVKRLQRMEKRFNESKEKNKNKVIT